MVIKNNELLRLYDLGQREFNELEVEEDWVEFHHIILDNASFFHCFFEISFQDCSFKNTSFIKCNLKSVRFINCDLTNALFSSCSVESTDFSGSVLSNTKFDTNFAYGGIANQNYLNEFIKGV